MSIEVSVIICTHNPREHYLHRVLNALRNQTLQVDRWELLLIDNKSEKAVETRFDLSWHCNGKHIMESELGLTHARLRGIRESVAPLLVTVDDDNVLDPDYLAKAVDIYHTMPFMGAWTGMILPEYETPPCPEIEEFQMLALNLIAEDRWSNYRHNNPTIPCGAGMCFRKTVAERYEMELRTSSIRRSLDRKGANLNCAGDLDLALTACDLGLAVGYLHKLKMVHLIPKERVQPAYYEKLIEGTIYSVGLLEKIRGGPVKKPERFQLLRRLGALLISKPLKRRFLQAVWRGIDRAAAVKL